MTSLSRIILAASILALAPQAFAQAPAGAATLKAGDPAPKLAVGKWIQGEPVTEYSHDKVYLVEFWATWCGPCKASIPHLNELHHKYADQGLVVIGQNILEPKQEGAEPFVKGMGDKMSYRVAIDSVPQGADFHEGGMVKTWMVPAAQRGIPFGVLVDKTGTVAWIGNPGSLTDAMVEQVLAGKYDIASERAKEEAATNAQAAANALRASLDQALQDQKWDEASKLIDKMEAPGAKTLNAMTVARLQVALGKKDSSAVNKIVDSLINPLPSDPGSGTSYICLASLIATADSVDGINLEATERMARLGVEATAGKFFQFHSRALATLARVVFRSGRKDEAVKIQEEATEAEKVTSDKKAFIAVRDAYKEGKLPPATPISFGH
jgi:thiol-disulfide isomerase/thioredoxin